MPDTATKYGLPFEVILPAIGLPGWPRVATRAVDVLGDGFFRTCAVLYVSDGISNGATWFTAYRMLNGSERRLKRLALPCRTTAEEAEDDLREYASKKGWFLHRTGG